MALATAHTVALQGALGHLIDVQADVSPGTPGTTLVGRPDATLHEARDRCRMAVSNSGVLWPATRRVTILLAPSDLVKRGTHFDLAIALAVLAACGDVTQRSLSDTLVIGELTLTGGLRSVPGVLPMVMAASRRGFDRVIVPEPQAREAAMVPGMTVLGMRSLAQVRAELRGDPVPEAPPVAPMSGSRLIEWRGSRRLTEHDLADLGGVPDVKYALEVAAAGGHHLMLSGPKGSGKTSLAERLPGILPDLSVEESLELTAIHSLAGALEPGDDLIVRPPFFAPHHDASKASLLGGGTGRVRPGEVSRVALRRAVPRRVPAVPQRRDRRAAPAPGERRGDDRPRRGVGHLPRPGHGGDGVQPVPLRGVRRRLPPATGAPAPSSSGTTTHAG